MTRPISLLSLGIDIAQAHERAADASLELIPIVVDDLAAASPVLDALVQLLDGVMLDCGHADLQRPVVGTTDIVRRTAVATALTTAASGEKRRVELRDTPDGELDAVLLDPPAGPDPSEGERTVMAVARAFAHGELDTHSFGVVRFSAYGIDFPFRRAIWSLVVDHLRGLPTNRLRTLAVVVEDTIDVPLHCQTDRGFRLSVQGERLLKRRGRDDLNAHAARVSSHPETVVLFLGAGFGYSTGLPLGNGVRDSAIRRLLNIDSGGATDSELGRRFYRWVSERNWMTASEAALGEEAYVRELTLEQVIRAEQRFTGGALPTLEEFRQHHDVVIETPGPAVTDLAYILSQRVGRVILVEVNFDRLRPGLRVRRGVRYVKRYLAGAESHIPLLKIHGDINSPETCVVSAEQTELGIGAEKLEALRAVFEGLAPDDRRWWIYVGTSMRDRDLVPVLQSEEFARRLEELWVTPFIPETVEHFALQRLPYWAKRDWTTLADRVITEQADAFFAAWRAAL
jgi:hypothetical protein